MAKAMGMIETKGLIGSIEAADAMIKAADVSLVNQEKIDGALVTVLIEGDVSAVQAAVEVGKEAAARVGELIAWHVIPHPDEDVRSIVKKDKQKTAKEQAPSKKEKSKEIKQAEENKEASAKEAASKNKKDTASSEK
ncbi:BMC domain-containing protein [Scopulibacillus cellulosilyticus]|uniref:BMC domain-containing protein n=1 Tax=Scopulibacillus cellulosilyticus TaxID=2665665 RepID=A0ABW2PTA8_9BACL